MGLFGGTSRAATLNYDETIASCCVALQITSGTPSWHFVEYQKQDVSSENISIICTFSSER